MTRKSVRSCVLFTSFVLSSVSLVACTASEPDAEATATQEQPVQTATLKEIPDILVNPYIDQTIDPQHCGFRVVGSAGTQTFTFTPSSALSALVKMSGPVSATFALPPVQVPGPLGPVNYLVTITDLQTVNGANQVLIKDGVLHAQSTVKSLALYAQGLNGLLSPDVTISFAPFTIGVDIALENGVFLVAAVSIPLPTPSVTCGVANWCAGMVASSVGMASARIANEVKNSLTNELRKPDVLQGIVNGLTTFETSQHPAQAGVRGAPSVRPNSVSIAPKPDGSTVLAYVVDQLLAPTPPGTCSTDYSGGCDVTLNCLRNNAAPETLVMQHSDDGVNWFDLPGNLVGVDSSSGNFVAAAPLDSGYDANTTVYFRVCNRNVLASACSPAVSVVPRDLDWCSQIAVPVLQEIPHFTLPGELCPGGVCIKSIGVKGIK